LVAYYETLAKFTGAKHVPFDKLKTELATLNGERLVPRGIDYAVDDSTETVGDDIGRTSRIAIQLTCTDKDMQAVSSTRCSS